jgi:diguanylate cyclase (GGDEF)-like protein
MAQSTRQEQPLSLLLVDLDHFQRINDTRSHAVGDEVLRQVAGLLQSATGELPGGIAARMGGEEFLVLLPGMDRAEGTERLERLRRDIAAHPWADVTDGISVTVSVGVASAPTDATARADLLSVADENLYRAKRAGRDQVVG